MNIKLWPKVLENWIFAISAISTPNGGNAKVDIAKLGVASPK